MRPQDLRPVVQFLADNGRMIVRYFDPLAPIFQLDLMPTDLSCLMFAHNKSSGVAFVFQNAGYRGFLPNSVASGDIMASKPVGCLVLGRGSDPALVQDPDNLLRPSTFWVRPKISLIISAASPSGTILPSLLLRKP